MSIPAGFQKIALTPLWSESGYLDEFLYVPEPPELEIAVVPSTAPLASGAHRTFGDVLVGGGGDMTLSIRNKGVGYLDIGSVGLDGANASDFRINQSPAALVAPGESTSLSVHFAPQGPGEKLAYLRLITNDRDETSYVLTLLGNGMAAVVGRPAIVDHPSDLTAARGDLARFSVSAAGSGLAYQWLKDGVEIPAARTSEHRIASTQPWHAGAYTVRVSNASGTMISVPASLRVQGSPAGPWRGMVAYYPLENTMADSLRPAAPAELVNAGTMVADAERGSVLSVSGKGFGTPPFPWESPDQYGPGGYVRIPRPLEAAGESFTVALWIKEQGYSSWHGEAFLTIGEGASSAELIGRSWVGGLEGLPDSFGVVGVGSVEPVAPGSVVVGADGAAVVDSPWTSWVLAASGGQVRYYRQGVYRGSLPYPQATAGDVFIGRHWWVDGGLRYSTRFRGRVDDVRFFNRALSATEVRQLYVETQAPPAPGPFGAWGASNGLSGTAGALLADPDADGFNNLQEFCFGGDPRAATTSVFDFFATETNTVLEWFGRPEVTYRSMSSSYLKQWLSAGFPIIAVDDQSGTPAGYRRLNLILPLPDPSEGAGLFAVRIEAEVPPVLSGDGRLEVEPANKEPAAGDSLTLATGVVGPGDSYQWFKNGEAMAGAAEPTLTIAGVDLADSGAYSVAVTNSAGTTRSRPAYIRVVSPSLPTVATSLPVATGMLGGSAGGMVVDDGDAVVRERGAVYSTTPGPTLSNATRAIAQHGPVRYALDLTALEPATTYYVRAYAINSVGVAYGQESTFTTARPPDP